MDGAQAIAKREPQVQSELANLNRILQRTDELLTHLAGRLVPVLRSEPSCPQQCEAEATQARIPTCPLYEDILVDTRSVIGMNDLLSDLLERLEV
jgi:hypothetical protein